jgi:hypothetical protein
MVEMTEVIDAFDHYSDIKDNLEIDPDTGEVYDRALLELEEQSMEHPEDGDDEDERRA